MADVHTKEQRSYNMSRIKGKEVNASFTFVYKSICFG